MPHPPPHWSLVQGTVGTRNLLDFYLYKIYICVFICVDANWNWGVAVFPTCAQPMAFSSEPPRVSGKAHLLSLVEWRLENAMMQIIAVVVCLYHRWCPNLSHQHQHYLHQSMMASLWCCWPLSSEHAGILMLGGELERERNFPGWPLGSFPAHTCANKVIILVRIGRWERDWLLGSLPVLAALNLLVPSPEILNPIQSTCITVFLRSQQLRAGPK